MIEKEPTGIFVKRVESEEDDTYLEGVYAVDFRSSARVFIIEDGKQDFTFRIEFDSVHPIKVPPDNPTTAEDDKELVKKIIYAEKLSDNFFKYKTNGAPIILNLNEKSFTIDLKIEK